MGKFRNLIGQTFYRLTVIGRSVNNTHNQVTWLCVCSCNPDIILQKNITSSQLIYNNTKSCGCLKKEIKNHDYDSSREEYINKIYNGCKILDARSDKDKKYPKTIVRVLCYCGNEFETQLKKIKSGHTKSCGCYGFRKNREKALLNSQAQVGKIYNGCEILKCNFYPEKKTEVEVKCFCENIFITNLFSLKGNLTKSCGCLQEKYYQNLLNFYEKNGYVVGYIYLIKNLVTNNFYVGKTYDLQKRWKQHIHEMSLVIHSNKFLQEDFNLYGENSFVFEIVTEYQFKTINELNENLIKKEKYWIETIKPVYNIQHAKKYTKCEEQIYFRDWEKLQ